MFVAGGWDAFSHPEGKVKAAEKVTIPVSRHVTILPEDTETLVRLNGGLQMVAGSLLAIGKLRRLSALALAGSIIPTTLAGHRFWEELDDEARVQQRVHFLKNLGLLGGLLLAATDTEGAPSFSWRLRQNVSQTGSKVASHVGTSEDAATKAAKKAQKAATQTLQRATHSKRQARQQLRQAKHQVEAAERSAQRTLRHASASGQRALRHLESIPVRETAAKGAAAASHYLSTGADLTEAVLSQAREHLAAS
jgi:putative oxidoreductase